MLISLDMAATIPAPLKAADIARFALRAGQLEKAKPVVAYYCKPITIPLLDGSVDLFQATTGLSTRS